MNSEKKELVKEFTTDSVKGMLLLFLALTATFLGSVLNCSIQDILSKNNYVKYITVLFFIYFSINITSSPNQYPLYLLGNTIFIFVLFLLLMKQNKVFFIINFLLIISIYICWQYINYYKNKKNNRKVKQYEKAVDILEILLIIFLLIGFLFVKEKGLFNPPTC